MPSRPPELSWLVEPQKTTTWMTYVEAMQVLGVGRSTLDGWRKSGRIIFSKLPNGQLRIRRAELDQWLEDLAEEWVPLS